MCTTCGEIEETRLTGTDRFTFQVIGDSYAYSVSKGTAVTGEVHIPAYYRPSADSQYLPVMSIDAFNNCTGLTSVTFPASVTSIGSGTFSGCSSLTSVTIHASVTNLSSMAFADCTSLASIIVDANNPHYASQDGIVYNKAKTTILIVPNGISGHVTLPASVTSLGFGAEFENCTGLTSVTIPVSVTIIDFNGGLFFGCTSLVSITVAGNNPNYASEGGILYNKARTTLIYAPKGISGHVTIPAGVTSIGGAAFASCTSLASVTLPAGVTSIGGAAFASWISSQTINVQGKSQAEADAVWGSAWLRFCDAVINYNVP